MTARVIEAFGTCLILGGVYLLLGPGPALITAGAALLALAYTMGTKDEH